MLHVLVKSECGECSVHVRLEPTLWGQGAVEMYFIIIIIIIIKLNYGKGPNNVKFSKEVTL